MFLSALLGIALHLSPAPVQNSRWLSVNRVSGLVELEVGGGATHTETDGAVTNRKDLDFRDSVRFLLTLSTKSVQGSTVEFSGSATVDLDVHALERNSERGETDWVVRETAQRLQRSAVLPKPARLIVDASRGTYSFVIEANDRFDVPVTTVGRGFVQGDPLNSGTTLQDAPIFTPRMLSSLTVRAQGADVLEWLTSWVGSYATPVIDPTTLNPMAMTSGAGFALPPSGSVIRGERRWPFQFSMPDQTRRTEQVLRWSFVADPKPVRLAVTIPGHKEWMPEAGGAAGGAGNRMSLRAQVVDANGAPTGIVPERVTFRLAQVSREPGVAMNAPARSESVSPDLAFEAGQNVGAVVRGEGLEAVFSGGTGRAETVATLTSFDYGGFGRVEVRAELPGGQVLIGELDTGEDEILVPHRKSGSRIATAWQPEGADLSDDEMQEGNPHRGDGFSLYEEYRGAFARGTHKRLDPKKKELFVNYRASQFREGLALFASASGLTVHEVADEELRDRRVNFNSQEGLVWEQCGVIVKETSTPAFADLLGNAVPLAGPGGLRRWPADLRHIELTADIPADQRETMVDLVAHELTHAVGLEHHGPDFEEAVPYALKEADRLFSQDGSPYPRRPEELKSTIQVIGGTSSGDPHCLCAYPHGSWLATRNGSGGWDFRRFPEGMGLRRFRLCRTPAALEFNAQPGGAGDASEGACFSKVRLRP